MKNKLIISIDGVRKDRLACYNSKMAWLTPNIARIYPECVLFDDVMSASTSTAQCFSTIFTGKNSVEFGRKLYGDSQMPFSHNVFSDHEEIGYKTVVCVNKRIESWIKMINTFSNAEFWWTGKSIAESDGKTKDSASFRPKEQVEYFIDRADKEKKPLMSWLHLVGFSSPDPRFNKLTPFEYDARVAEMDEAIGIFFDHFKGTSEIYIFADHGYALFEQGRWSYGKNGHSLVQPVLDVPLLVYNGEQTGVNQNLVSQIRIRDIIRDSGISLEIKDEMVFCETRYVEQHDLALAVRKGKYKLSYYFSDDRHQFYDLSSDPLENIDYASDSFHKLKRNDDGTHPSLKPFILRTDWDELREIEDELLKIAKNYYGPETIARHEKSRRAMNKNPIVRSLKSAVKKCFPTKAG